MNNSQLFNAFLIKVEMNFKGKTYFLEVKITMHKSKKKK
jgi:hypothetical protein